MKPLRLLLIDPPFYRLYKDGYGLCKLPLGVASLAAVALETGLAAVKVINADFHAAPEPFSATYLAGEGYAAFRRNLADPEFPAYAALRQSLTDFAPDVIGITVRTPAVASALACARLAKATCPRALIVAGGPHPSVAAHALLSHPEVDVAVSGEGEAVLTDLLRAVAAGTDPALVGGLLLRHDGNIVATPSRPLLTDLDALPFPVRYASQFLDDYERFPPRAFGFLFSARGCPHGCAYCSSKGVWGRRVRFRSVDNVLEELVLLRAMGVAHVHFDDDTFGVTSPRLLALCRALAAAGLGLTYSCETHVDCITEKTVAALAEAGFTTVQLGLESGDDVMLGRIGKGFTVARACRAAGLIKAAGIRLEAFFMVGFPAETEESLARTRRLMETLDADKLIYSIFTPYPGTPLFEECRNLGLIRPDYDFSRHNHQSPENAFCPHIAPPRFRALAGAIETLVAAKNAASRPQG